MLSLYRVLALLALAGLLQGCLPASEGASDERKDPYFLSGKKRVLDRDYDGAIEAFEKALEANPQSASAHYELGVIYDEQKHDYAAALYHYERTVRLQPNKYPSDNARERIPFCKIQLAKSVVQMPSERNLQSQIDKLQAENQLLRQRLEEWQKFYAQYGVSAPQGAGAASTAPPGRSTSGATSRTGATRSTPVVTETPTPTHSTPTPSPTARGGYSDTQRLQPLFPSRPAPGTPGYVTPLPTPAARRTHVVSSRETMASIARRHGVGLNALLAANPRVDPRRIKVGQTIYLP